jgi:hypothetical protein
MSDNLGMQNALQAVVFGTVAVSVVMSVYLLFSRERTHDEIGEDGIVRDDLIPMAPAPLDEPLAEREEREREVRQMLSARSERLVRAGEPALDVDAEVARLLAPPLQDAPDPGLTEEVRQLVVARNERRVRKGLEPLEVEAEVARTLAEFDR